MNPGCAKNECRQGLAAGGLEEGMLAIRLASKGSYCNLTKYSAIFLATSAFPAFVR